MKKLLSYVAIIVMLSSCYAVRAYKFRKLTLQSHEQMPHIALKKSATPYEYIASTNIAQDNKNWLDSNLAGTKTAAFLIIKNDTVLYEKYFDQYNSESLLPSFSVIKSYIGTLTGIALQEGKINSLQLSVTEFIPELIKNDTRFGAITIQHLLDMESGITWTEGSYNLKDDAIKMGFRPDIKKQLKKLRIASAPTTTPDYASINTFLLGVVISRATEMPLQDYFSAKLWGPLGANSAATLTTDKKGWPVTYAGLNATARDFAKLGSLYLHDGSWNGQQIITPEWVKKSIDSDTLFANELYKNQWWGFSERQSFKDSITAVEYFKQIPTPKRLSYNLKKSREKTFFVSTPSANFMAKGILGQYIYVRPGSNLVIVRLGYYWQHPEYYAESFIKQVADRFGPLTPKGG